MKYLILIAISMLLPSTIHANVYKCPDSEGSVYFSDRACSDGHIKIEEQWITVKEYNAKKEREELLNAKLEEEAKKKRERERQLAIERREAFFNRQPKKTSSRRSIIQNKEEVSISFNDCLTTQNRTIASLGVSSSNIIPIINHKNEVVTRVCTSDGSILISCNRLTSKMTIVHSSAQGVGCL